jgi:flagellar capping protein FliD
MESVDLSNLTVDSSGRVIFSGLSSGIDIQGIVGDIIAAKRIPIDTIETRITENADQITALGDLRALLTSLRQSLSTLRGAVTLGDTGDVFSATQVFATTSRTDGDTPSAAGNLIGVSTTNAASTGSHTIEVLRTAAAQKVASSTFSSETTALSLSGTFDVTGGGGSATITVSSSDTLQDIRDNINTANTGASGTGVNASVVEISDTEFILVLTADDAGIDMAITDTGTVLSGLGISSTNGAGGYRNGLADADSKIEATNDGFMQIAFDGSQADNSFLISYDQATFVMTLTRGDGTTDTVTLDSSDIDSGETETLIFSDFGVTIVLDDTFDKATDITVEADAADITVGTATIAAGTISITDSAGNISGIDSSTLTFDLTTAATATLTITNSGDDFVSAAFDATATGVQTITLIDAGDSANTITVTFDIQTAGFADGDAATITLNELKNLVSSTGTPFDNEIQTAETARFTADGLVDIDRFESTYITSSTNTLSTLAPDAGDGDFDITVGGNTVTVSYLGADTLSGLVTKINAAITGSGGAVESAGTAASLMTDGDGVRLVITNTSGAEITLTDTDGLISGLGIDNDLVIERDSNTVSDLFDGVTLTLFQAEEETKIKIDVEQDLTSAKTAIEGFVEAYNALKVFLNQHSQIDSTTGAAAEDAGVLLGSPALFGVTTSLSSIFSVATSGVDDAFQVLAQVGITFVDNSDVGDSLLFNTLEISDTDLDEALLNNAADVKRLFAFDYSTSDSRVSLLGFDNKTTYDAAGYTLNINFADEYQSDSLTDGGSFTEVDAITGGPAADGMTIAFDDSVLSDNAYRYSYDDSGGEELLTLTDLTSGTSETIDITSIMDTAAVVNGAGGNLDGSETATIDFSTLGVTFTLDAAFDRNTSLITEGAIDVSGQIVAGTNGFSPATATVTYDNDGDITDSVVTALKAIVTTNGISYDAATGKLTIAIESDGANVTTIRDGTGSGVSFQIDGAGGFSEDGTSLADLEDGFTHSIEIKVDGQVIATTALGIVTSTGAGTDAAIVIDVGAGLFSETSTMVSTTSPLENYMSLTAGDQTFEIYDSDSNLLGTVTYNGEESLTDLRTSISAISGISGALVSSSGNFLIEILEQDRDVLTFSNDTGGLLTELNLTNTGDGVFSANFGGAADGSDDTSASVDGRTITALSLTGAEGLQVYYSGTEDLDSVQLDFTTGFGERLYFAIDAMLDPTTGLMDTNVASLTNQNEERHDRVDDMVARLELTRESLLQRFIAMEVALARIKNLRETLTQTFDAMFASSS